MKISSTIYISIFIITFFLGCKKDEEPFLSNIEIKIINESGIEIDSLTVCNGELSSSDKKNFYSISNNSETDFMKLSNIKSNFFFIIYFDSTYCSVHWKNPGSVIDDESRTSYMPPGHYAFSLFDYDSVSSDVTIGLIYYYN